MKAKLYATLEKSSVIIRTGDDFYLGLLMAPIGEQIEVDSVQKVPPWQVLSLMAKADYKRERDQLLEVPDSWKKLKTREEDFEPARFLKILNSIKPPKK